VKKLSEELIAGHYHFCNDFIWPLMHDLPQHVSFNPVHQDHYREFNIRFADLIQYEHQPGRCYFVQDYQLASVPRFLSLFGARSEVFWHIPWPCHVPSEFVGPLSEIVRSLLRADVLGFHTHEYARRFMEFVWQYLPEFGVDGQNMFVQRVDLCGDDLSRRRGVVTSGGFRGTRLAVQPLGINVNDWNSMADSPDLVKLPDYVSKQFVLSVDRADYTKSVSERMDMVLAFFRQFPHLKEQLTFVQVCGRTRPGLRAFDRYWDECRTKYELVNEELRTGDWQPVCWLEKSLTPKQLASLYQSAAAMLVNPVKDGLNLTAKEFVACSRDNPGVLLLSDGAGAWHELGRYALKVDPHDIELSVESLQRALSMGRSERQLRMDLMKAEVEGNPMDQWWAMFSKLACVQPAKPLRDKLPA
jgi:trehalose 6-phosphate synthase/phosphatase